MTKRGPQGVLLLLIGLALAAGALWGGLGGSRWTAQLPVLLTGLSLMSFGWSAWSRARRTAQPATRQGVTGR